MGPLRAGLCLFTVCAAAKAAVVLRQRWADGTPLPAPWSWGAFLHEDLLVAALLALAVAAARAAAGPRCADRAAVAAYALLVAWTALNVPVMTELSSPITFSFLHAAGGALGDSFARSMHPFTVLAPLALAAAAALLPRVRARSLAVVALAGAALAATGPFVVARAETRGLHRSPVAAIVATTWRRHDSARDGARLASTPRPCATVHAARGDDLRHLAGTLRGRNVVWVILESTGARALPAYGARADMTPHLSALAREALVWDRAYAAYPESIKGLFSMLCSRLPPPDSEASDYAAGRLPCPSIAQAMAEEGYRTGLFHSGRFAFLGMDAVVQGRGFGALADASSIPSDFTSSFGVDDRSTVRALLGWIDAAPRDRPFFAVYMPIAGHHPYHAPGDAPRPLPERSLRDEYLNDLHVGDEAFGRLRAGMRARGLDERTMYVVVGDHGEAFHEHPGNVVHALHLFDENVRVPLFVAAPGAPAVRGRARQVTSLIDLAPTTLELLGIAASPAHQGRSALDPAPSVVRFFTEQAVRRAGTVDGPIKVLLDLDTGRAQVHDLGADPDERVDLARDRPADVGRARACLSRPTDFGE